MRIGGTLSAVVVLVLASVGCEHETVDLPVQAGTRARTGTTDHGLAEAADHIVELMNDAREKRGLGPLRPHPALIEAARRHSVDMVEGNFLGHESRDGSTLRERLPADFKARTVGENVWGGSLAPLDSLALARKIFTSWMESPGHRRNIESKDYAYIGVAVAAADGEVRAVQVFASEPQ